MKSETPVQTEQLDSTASKRRRRFLCAFTVCLVPLLTMSRLFRAEFTPWDDNHTITENADFAPPTMRTLGSMWFDSRASFGLPIRADLYVPLTYSLWWGLSRASVSTDARGEFIQSPYAFHAANVVLHAMSSLAVFALLRRLILRHGDDSPDEARIDVAAALGALLFAVHPLQVEAVAWASGLKDVLSGLLSAVSLWQYVSYAQISGNTSQHEMSSPLRRAAARHYLCAFAAFVLAVLAKPIAVVVPALAIAIDVILIHRKARAIARGVAPMLVVSLAGIAIARFAQGAEGLSTLVSPPWRLPVALDAIAFYLYKLFVPFSLAFDYGRHPRAVVAGPMIAWTWLLPVIALLAVWFARRPLPFVAAGAAMFILALAPVLGFVPFDFQEYSTVADHYMYIPMMGVALAFAGTLATLRPASWRGAIVVIGAIIVALSIRSIDQTRHWKDGVAMMRRAIAVNPQSWVAYSNLGAALIESGPHHYDEALAAQHRSLGIRPDNAAAHMHIGRIELERHELESAVASFQRALSSPRRDATLTTQAHTNLANALGQLGRFDDAVAEYELALRADPTNRKARRMLDRTRAFLRTREGRPQEESVPRN